MPLLLHPAGSPAPGWRYHWRWRTASNGPARKRWLRQAPRAPLRGLTATAVIPSTHRGPIFGFTHRKGPQLPCLHTRTPRGRGTFHAVPPPSLPLPAGEGAGGWGGPAGRTPDRSSGILYRSSEKHAKVGNFRRFLLSKLVFAPTNTGRLGDKDVSPSKPAKDHHPEGRIGWSG